MSQPISLFIWYFLFCVLYAFLSQRAFGSLNPAELRAMLKRRKPQSEDIFIASVSGESGTSHATMFSVVALVGVSIITIRSRASDDQTQLVLLHVSGLLTILGSWISNVVSFALQYARDDARTDRYGFRYPDGVQPM